MKTEVNIAGFNVPLTPMDDNLLKRLPVNVYVRYYYSVGMFKGVEMCFLEEKEEGKVQPPMQSRKTADKLSEILRCPIVFVYNKMHYIQRQRMIERGVYFVVSGKYANLPNLFVNALDSQKNEKVSSKLSPTAQYILLYFLQHHNCDFDTIASIQRHTPFSYLQVTRAVVDLENFGLCNTDTIPLKGKSICFSKDKRDLWEKSREYMRNPVKKTIYTDMTIPFVNSVSLSGINALAHYSSINQVRQESLALSTRDFKALTASNIELNSIEGSTAIQEWIYPPTICSESEYVDPLSLWLSLSDDKNPRVEDALEQLIEKMKW